MQILCNIVLMDLAEVRDAVDQRRAGDRSEELWKLALYWASRNQFWDGTPRLKDPQTPHDGLPHITQYRFFYKRFWSSWHLMAYLYSLVY